MTVNINEVKNLILKSLPNSKINIIDTVGDGNHLEATIISDEFANKSLIARHKLVYDALGSIVGNEIHALSLIVKTNAELSNLKLAETTNNLQGVSSHVDTTAHSYAGSNDNTNLEGSSLLKKIDDAVKNHKVLLFMKGEKENPMCGFSSLVVQILQLLNVEFETVNILSSEEIREGIKVYSNWPTIPQLYIAGKLIGGADISRSMYESGELVKLLTQEGIAFKINQ